MLWPIVPTVAAADFDPFTREVAMPVTAQSASSRPRAVAKPGAVSWPKRLNLLEMGLACGDGAAELEARMAEAAATAARADADERTESGGDQPGDDDDGAKTATAPDPSTIAAATTALQAMHQRRSRLAEELATLDRQEATLRAELMRLLNPDRPHGGRAPSCQPYTSSGYDQSVLT